MATISPVFQVLNYTYTNINELYDIVKVKYAEGKVETKWVNKDFFVACTRGIHCESEPLMINGFYRAELSSSLRMKSTIFNNFQKAHSFDSKFLPY